MSNKQRKHLPFIPAEFPEPGRPEVPNYVIPTNELDYRRMMDQAESDTEEGAAGGRGEDCRG